MELKNPRAPDPPSLVTEDGEKITLKRMPRRVLDTSIISQIDTKIGNINSRLADLAATLSESNKRIHEFDKCMEAAGKKNTELSDQNHKLRERLEDLNKQNAEIISMNQELADLVRAIQKKVYTPTWVSQSLDDIPTATVPASIELVRVNNKNDVLRRQISNLLNDIEAPSGIISWIEILEIFGETGQQIYRADMTCALELLLEGESVSELVVDLRDKLVGLLNNEPYKSRMLKAVGTVLGNMITYTFYLVRKRTLRNSKD